jgi:hypothetical protein
VLFVSRCVLHKRTSSVTHRILIAILVALACRQAAACDCWISDPNRQVERADIVFAGRVTGIEAAPWPGILPAGHTMPAQPRLPWTYGLRQVSFEIERAIKGTAVHTISLWTGSGGGDCGIDFRPALTYLVLARYDSGHRLIADLCGGTVWLGDNESGRRFGWLLDKDFTVSHPEPYDVPMAGVMPPLLIGVRFPELSPTDKLPIVLEIDREGHVTHFSYAVGPPSCLRPVARSGRRWRATFLSGAFSRPRLTENRWPRASGNCGASGRPTTTLATNDYGSSPSGVNSSGGCPR